MKDKLKPIIYESLEDVVAIKDVDDQKGGMLKMDGLKPCPFCGGEAVIGFKPHYFYKMRLPDTRYYAICKECKAQTF